jgi:single-strand DNA-binding protein
MAGSVNKVILVGNLGADPGATQGRPPDRQRRVASRKLATRQPASGARKTEWHRVVIFSEGLRQIAGSTSRRLEVYLGRPADAQMAGHTAGPPRPRSCCRAFNSALTMLDRAGGGAGADGDFGSAGPTASRERKPGHGWRRRQRDDMTTIPF